MATLAFHPPVFGFVFGFYCEESVNLDLGPGNVLGEAFFSSCKGLTGAVSDATGQIGEIRQPFGSVGILPQGNRLKSIG